MSIATTLIRRSARNRPSRTPLTLRSLIVTLGVGVAFLGFACVISLLAPIHVLNLHREDRNDVRADLTQRVLLVMPIRNTTLAAVRNVRIRTYTPPAYTNPKDPTVVVRPEEQSYLVLEGERGLVEIASSTVNVGEAEKSIKEFLSASDSQRRLWLISNWKFGVLAPVLIVAPGLIILLGAVWDIAVWFATHRATSQHTSS